jgi:dolichol-phosphate mannosyltransferase
LKKIIIIPTYNEIQDIKFLIDSIFDLKSDFHILIVDDNSPDGTGDMIEGLKKDNEKLDIIRRKGKLGLGTAYIAGFKYAIKNDFDLIFQMDADQSHQPIHLSQFEEVIKDNDLVIGSRYIDGISIVHWDFKRLLMSKFANWYSQTITGFKITDMTSGFRCFKRRVLETLNLDKIQSTGYSFQIEMAYKTAKAGFKVGEIPIIFVGRFHGSTKMTYRIIAEAAFIPWYLRFGFKKG